MRRRAQTASVYVAAALLALAVGAPAAGPVLHEFIEADASEDLEVGATTPDGRMPAAARTPSGIISAPPTFAGSSPRQVAYGGGSTPDSIDATYRIDRDTTQPDSVRYDDPFTPAVAPFKRLYAFDTVDAELELGVAEKELSAVTVGGHMRPADDHFFGDLFVDVAPGVPVRVPTVGPGTRLLALRVEPPMKLEVRRDGAENLFVLGESRQRVRLILELAAPRASFGAPYAAVSYADLARYATPLPRSAQGVVREVLSRLGLSQVMTPRDALTAMVAHFRAFAPSEELPAAQNGPALYRELVLGKKGVCRHRAYGFVLTALGLGIPARFVRNEAHAWVEVFDARIWHRIDLGGAAGRFDIDTRAGAPPHAVPSDPYAWPEGAASGLEAAVDSGMSGPPGGAGANAPPQANGGSDDTRAPGAPDAAAEPPGAANAPPSEPTTTPAGADQPTSRVELSVGGDETRRGAALRVSGAVTSAGNACPHARVDITLSGPHADALIGSVPTDAQGRFDSRVTIPFDIEVGEYTLRAWTPGAAACGPSE